jgi:hypothetical protein
MFKGSEVSSQMIEVRLQAAGFWLLDARNLQAWNPEPLNP